MKHVGGVEITNKMILKMVRELKAVKAHAAPQRFTSQAFRAVEDALNKEET